MNDILSNIISNAIQPMVQRSEAIRLIKLQPFFDCFYRGKQWSKGQQEVLKLRGAAELQINRILR